MEESAHAVHAIVELAHIYMPCNLSLVHWHNFLFLAEEIELLRRKRLETVYF